MIEKKQQRDLRADQAEIMAPKMPYDEINGTLCNCILYDISFSENAIKKARGEHRKNSLHDGFTMRFIIESAIEGDGSGAILHKYVDIAEDGTVKWSDAVEEGLFIKGWDTCNSYALKYAQIKDAIGTEKQECVAYATLWEIKYGIPFDIAIALLNSFQKKHGVGEFDATELKVGDKKVPKLEYGTGLRFTVFKRVYKDKNGDIQNNWSTWDKKTKKPMATDITIIPQAISDKIYSAVVKMTEERRKAKEGSTTFAYGANTPDKDTDLEKAAGF